MRKEPEGASRLLGTFSWKEEQEIFGELLVQGESTLLQLRHEGGFAPLESNGTIFGKLHDLTRVSCLHCVGGGPGHAWRHGEERYYFADVFPHFVLIGGEHFDPSVQALTSVSFSVSDIQSIFNDVGAFGRILGLSHSIAESVIPKMIGRSPVRLGESPQIAYFSGQCEIVVGEIECGTLSVRHWPHYDTGGAGGIALKSEMMITVDFRNPASFDECIQCIWTVTRFMSLIAGRRQGIKSVSVVIADEDKPRPTRLQLHWSFAPKGPSDSLLCSERPESRDMPLDAVQRPDEFVSVLKDWWIRDSSWRPARFRYHFCLEKENHFDVDRLIAAANMFDILPKDAVPVDAALAPALSAARDECLKVMRRQPFSIERDSAIAALKRMGNPSLPKKVLSRVEIVTRRLGGRFPELEMVARQAVNCRNYFVHGGSGFNYSRLEDSVSFFTETLEFIFATSDLIQAGWNAGGWGTRIHTSGHWFTRFRADYPVQLEKLKLALA